MQSRYYNPELGRFINADSYTTTYETPVGANMFAYCCNNPVKSADSAGQIGHIAIGAIVGAAIGAATAGAVGVITGQSAADIGKAMAEGAILGVASEFCTPLILATAAAGYVYVDNAIEKSEKIKIEQDGPITEEQSLQISGSSLASAANTFVTSFVGGKLGDMAGAEKSYVVEGTLGYVSDLTSGVFDWMHQAMWEKRHM